MPITPVSYTPRPYVGGTSIGELMRLRGQHAADAELRRGELQAQMWANLGNTIAGGIQNYAKEKQEAPIRAQNAALREAQIAETTAQAEDRAQQAQARQSAATSQTRAGEGMAAARAGRMTRDQLLASVQDDPVALKTVTDSLAAIDARSKALREAKNGLLGEIAVQVHKHGNTPEAAIAGLDVGLGEHPEYEQEIERLRSQIVANPTPEAISQLTAAALANSPDEGHRRLLGEEADRKLRQQAEDRLGNKEPTLPTSAQEYEYAVKNGYKGTYDQYQTMDANRRRPISITNAGTDDAMVEEAARNILANPRDLTSIRTITTLRGDQRLKLFNKLKELNPDFNVGNIDRQVKFLDSYEDPKGRAAINRSSMNNILMHAADLSAANQKYRRSNMRIVNTPIAALAKQSGTEWSQFMTPVSVLKDEIALYFAGGYAPTSDQQKTWDSIVNDKATPAQIEQFAKDIIHVGLRRADTTNQSFKTMMGYDDPNLITPDAVQAARNLGLGDAVKKYGSGGQIGARPAQPPPANVASALKGLGAGRHTLSDGSVWIVDAGGGITKAGP